MTNLRPGRATRLVATLGVAVLVATCGSTSTTPPSPGGPPASSGATSAPGPSAGGSEAAASVAPSVGSDGSSSPVGSATPFASASPSPRPGTADACSGTAENRDFYSALAASVAWDVYCATLPLGWFVDSGSYRLSSGGQLSITYRGPDGARLVVREGGYCVGHPDCVPSGTDAGAARFGDRDARLLDIGNGSWLVVVLPTGADVDWQAIGSGMDGAALGAFTAAFARVDQ